MRFLIVKTSALGDIIHAYPVLEYLKNRFPDCEIDWVAEKRTMAAIQPHPYVTNCFEIDTTNWRKNWWRKCTWQAIKDAATKIRKGRYDAVFDLQGNCKSAIITFLARATDKVGFHVPPERIATLVLTKRYAPLPEKNIRQDYLFIVQNYFNDFSQPQTHSLLQVEEPLGSLKANWMVCPGSNWKNKQLTKEQLIAFLTQCKQTYQPIFAFLAGSEQELSFAQELCQHFPDATIVMRPSIAKLQRLMSQLELVISMDSLPLHLAAVAGCATFSFFGPSSSAKYGPVGDLHGSFQGECPYGMHFEKRCTRLRSCPTGACLREQDPHKLFTAFAHFMSKV